MSEQKIIKVRTVTDVKKLAGSIIHCHNEGFTPTLSAIGAGAVNTAIKACSIARSMKSIISKELILTVTPQMKEISIDGKNITVILLHVIIV